MVVRAGLLAVVVAASGCMGDPTISGDDRASTIAEDELSRLVLAPSDVPAELRLFDEGPVTSSDVAPGPREDPERFQRDGGWLARYRRTGEQDVSGPLVIESRVDLFSEPGGAERDLAAYREELSGTSAGDGFVRKLEPPDLGDAAVVVADTTDTTGGAVRYFTVAWRSANVTASIVVSGFAGRLTLDDALQLARRAQRRIDAELD